MQSIEHKESITVTANKTTRSVALSYSIPKFDEYREIKHILKENTILKIFNESNQVAIHEAAKQVARTLVRHQDRDIVSACYDLFAQYPLLVQKKALEYLNSSPALLEMFSFHIGAQEHYASTPDAAKTRKPRKAKISAPSADVTAMLAEAAITLGVE